MINKKLINLSKKINQLCTKGFSISIAESCTGGLLSAIITEIPGSSKYFSHGVVSYANHTKSKLLGVLTTTLHRFGAVSEETAKEMAIGCKRISGSNLAISITGIAGPAGGLKHKPVGMVCFAITTDNSTTAYTFYFEGGRKEIRSQACLKALELILLHIH